jgi:hypothetical protein
MSPTRAAVPNPPLLGSVVFGIVLLHITGLYLIEREYSRSR